MKSAKYAAPSLSPLPFVSIFRAPAVVPSVTTSPELACFPCAQSDSWEDMGANCNVSQPPQASSKSPVKRRFNEGSVDEVRIPPQRTQISLSPD